ISREHEAVPFIAHRIALFDLQIVYMHADDGRIFRGSSAGADLVILLLVESLGKRVADVVSGVPRTAFWPLLETDPQAVVPGSRRRLNVGNRLAAGIGGEDGGGRRARGGSDKRTGLSRVGRI